MSRSKKKTVQQRADRYASQLFASRGFWHKAAAIDWLAGYKAAVRELTKKARRK